MIFVQIQKKTKILILLSFLIAPLSIYCNPNFVITTNSNITIHVDYNSNELIKWAAADLSQDIEKILGKTATLSFTNKLDRNSPGIYIGKFNDNLIKSFSKKDEYNLENKWEKFIIQKNEDDLFIIGSDVRGTVYGIFEVAERIGISPWKWWADVNISQRDNITLIIPSNGIESEPSVQYRGIFLNDEDWGLQPWAAKTFEPETGDIGPKTYEKIFQLLLRLKANTILPAMHPCTKAFFKIPGNKEMAKKYHIFIGTSHAEPMLRNNVDEWNKEAYGEYNYFTNSINVKKYWQERITDVKEGNNIVTLGMRGIHDSGMKGNASEIEKVLILEKIINDQRNILSESFNKTIEEIPQVLIPYKEVLYLYNAGLKVPDDVTLMWTDDNYGYIRRLSNEQEQLRKGGSGIYYHISYWGRPHDYLWLSSTQPGLIWYEMTRAYENGAQKIWIVNVGDIKPAEYNMEFFLDLAWDINSITENSIKLHLINYCRREFGNSIGHEIADILEEYYRLAFLRKPEFMGWSQTEPTTETSISEFTTNNENELQRRIASYDKLYNQVEQVKSKIPQERKDAYFQLVEYSVKCAALMNQKFLYYQQAVLSDDTTKYIELKTKSEDAYHSIEKLTDSYNYEVANGKWAEMMSMNPRDLPVYSLPNYFSKDITPIQKKNYAEDDIPATIFIQASDFVNNVNPNNYSWQVIEGLGYSNSGVTLFPFTNKTFTDSLPYLEYCIKIKKVGKYRIEVRTLPTHSNNYDHKLWIEIDNEMKEAAYLNTKGRSEDWKTNVLRNYVSTFYSTEFNRPGEYNLKIFVNHTGIVLDQIAVNHEKTKKYYEIIN